MIARYCQADVIVIGLIGERGREVMEFVEKDLGKEGYAKSVVVCATSDTPPLVRLKGAHTATAIAEYFRIRAKSRFDDGFRDSLCDGTARNRAFDR